MGLFGVKLNTTIKCGGITITSNFGLKFLMMAPLIDFCNGYESLSTPKENSDVYLMVDHFTVARGVIFAILQGKNKIGVPTRETKERDKVGFSKLFLKSSFSVLL